MITTIRTIICAQRLALSGSELQAQAPQSGGRWSSSVRAELLYENVNSGGGFSQSDHYQVDFSVGETFFDVATATMPDVSLLFGLAPQMYQATGLTIGGMVNPVWEGDEVPLTFTAQFDDGTTAELDRAALGWTEGSTIDGFLPDGTVVVGRVYDVTLAMVEFEYLGTTASWMFTAENVSNDDFGPYAHDGIHDLYQVLLFGENDPQGHGSTDKDKDRFDNLTEYATGGDPKVPDRERPAPLAVVHDHPLWPEHNVIRFRRRDDSDGSLTLYYEVWASSDLQNWQQVTEQISQSAADPSGFVEVEFRDASPRGEHERRFYRLGFRPKDPG